MSPSNPPALKLPTVDRFGVSLSADASPTDIARAWFRDFSRAVEDCDATAASDLFLGDGFWRDVLALTSDYRTIQGITNIKKLLHSQLDVVKLSSLRLAEEVPRNPVFRKPFPDLTLLQVCFDFETQAGEGTGICRLVQTGRDEWKAYTMFTCLDSLKGYPERAGAHRDATLHTDEPWVTKRSEDIKFLNKDPEVLVIGGGHSGLEVAARLKALDVSTLVIEQRPRIGDGWRERYRSLKLHDTVWYNQTPYMPFPSTWPVYAPAPKLADFLESYATCLELDVWTSTTINQMTWNESDKKWTVELKTANNDTRTLRVSHLIFATGFGGGVPNMPNIPGQQDFKGTLVHSSAFTSAHDYAGRKAVVIGAANSAHDIARDFHDHGVDVTMYQRSSTFVISAKAVAAMLGGLYSEAIPSDLADRLNASFPLAVTKLLHQRVTPAIAGSLDKDVLDGLSKAGFKTNLGPDGAGLMQLLLRRAGGYYVDTGASQLIIDGSIKIKNGSAIQSFDEQGLKFDDGSRLDADVVVFATGFGDPREVVRRICGPDVASKLGPVWGVDHEGELNSAWRNSGHEGLWFAMGNLALSRFYSSALAIQIKSIQAGNRLGAPQNLDG